MEESNLPIIFLIKLMWFYQKSLAYNKLLFTTQYAIAI